MPIHVLTEEEKAAKISKGKSIYDYVSEGKTPTEAKTLIEAARAEETPAPETTTTTTLSPENPA